MRPQPVRTPSRLSDSVHHQLSMYALAASAAGVGTLALAQPAEAKIVYTKAHKVIHKLNDFVNLDLNHDGIVDFSLWLVHSRYPFVGAGLLAFPPNPSSTNTVRTSGARYWAIAYPAGVRIGPKGHAEPLKRAFDGALMEHGCAATSTTACESSGVGGNWVNVKNRYLGLTFGINGKIHYGWARLNASIGSRDDISATLTGYAYETIPNKPIITGKTKGPDVITVQPTSLGHLAAGASAIPAWRTGK